MESVLARAAIWLAVLLTAIMASAVAVDTPFAVHMVIVAIAAFVALAATLRGANYSASARAIAPDASRYDADPIRWGMIATVFWGMAGFFAGLYIALEFAFPVLNFGEYINFGRLRPLHTSAVIFAFGGNALIATSFYVVQRTCRARLAFPGLARFVFWGYQLFIVLAAPGYLLGVPPVAGYAAPGTAHLRGELVLHGLHHHGGRAAFGQQRGPARELLRGEKLLRVFRRAECAGAVVVWA